MIQHGQPPRQGERSDLQELKVQVSERQRDLLQTEREEQAELEQLLLKSEGVIMEIERKVFDLHGATMAQMAGLEVALSLAGEALRIANRETEEDSRQREMLQAEKLQVEARLMSSEDARADKEMEGFQLQESLSAIKRDERKRDEYGRKKIAGLESQLRDQKAKVDTLTGQSLLQDEKRRLEAMVMSQRAERLLEVLRLKKYELEVCRQNTLRHSEKLQEELDVLQASGGALDGALLFTLTLDVDFDSIGDK